jgi:hypothetical protein
MRSLPGLDVRSAARGWPLSLHAPGAYDSCQSRALVAPRMNALEPWMAPTDWFVYGHLHLILAVPTVAVLVASPPLQSSTPIYRQAAFSFVGFIVFIGVLQSFAWDSYGASNGFWEFNPTKCSLRDDFPLPVEEVLWLFHHVLKTSLYQLKAFELTTADTTQVEPTARLSNTVVTTLVAVFAFGIWALGSQPDDSLRCIGLVAAAFTPIWLLIWQLGSQFVLRHADRLAWGWIAPGLTTVLIDCLGQQQGVWRFPPAYLSGIGWDYLKLDIVLVYMVSTFAVAGTGAVVLAATEELTARRVALGLEPPDSLLEVWQYIRSRRLALGSEGAALDYANPAQLVIDNTRYE